MALRAVSNPRRLPSATRARHHPGQPRLGCGWASPFSAHWLSDSERKISRHSERAAAPTPLPSHAASHYHLPAHRIWRTRAQVPRHPTAAAGLLTGFRRCLARFLLHLFPIHLASSTARRNFFQRLAGLRLASERAISVFPEELEYMAVEPFPSYAPQRCFDQQDHGTIPAPRATSNASR